AERRGARAARGALRERSSEARGRCGGRDGARLGAPRADARWERFRASWKPHRRGERSLEPRRALPQALMAEARSASPPAMKYWRQDEGACDDDLSKTYRRPPGATSSRSRASGLARSRWRRFRGEATSGQARAAMGDRSTPNSLTTKPGRSASSISTSPGDRKSTRLNSSHVKISYAVFCLKKK